jgi:hypothetical protein
MSRALELLRASREGTRLDQAAIARTIDVCLDCMQACTACADACLSEDEVQDLVACIRLDQVCAEVCEAVATTLSIRAGHTQTLGDLLRACETACGACAEECERHAEHHEHCRICAEACRACERACAELGAALRDA